MNTYIKKEMKRLLGVYAKALKGKVLDVGSFNINGSLRKYVPRGWAYVGTDVIAGDNVDIVMESEYKIPVDNNKFDIVISTSCLEHCRNPFKLTVEMARVLIPGGYMIIVAPSELPIHKEQMDGTLLYDCWRFLPDGFNCLFEEAKMTVVHSYIEQRKINRVYCWGIARKAAR